jgi:hypothetical protein
MLPFRSQNKHDSLPRRSVRKKEFHGGGEALKKRDNMSRCDTDISEVVPVYVLSPLHSYPHLLFVFQNFKLARFSLLAAEQAEDEAVLKEPLSNWTLNRLKEEGYCLAGLSAFWLQANQFGLPVTSFLRAQVKILHSFTFAINTPPPLVNSCN